MSNDGEKKKAEGERREEEEGDDVGRGGGLGTSMTLMHKQYIR